MSRALLVAGGISLLVVAALVLAAILSAPGPASEAERVERIAAGLRCPDCQALSVAESRTRAAAAIRDEIATLVTAGSSDDEVRAHFVERYGQWILLAPDDPLAWWLPVGAIVLAVAAFGGWLWAGRSRPAAADPVPAPAAPAEADRRRVRDELEALDG
jgi:cytochrome c-type biogenesis protein CcmH/NrfF